MDLTKGEDATVIPYPLRDKCLFVVSHNANEWMCRTIPPIGLLYGRGKTQAAAIDALSEAYKEAFPMLYATAPLVSVTPAGDGTAQQSQPEAPAPAGGKPEHVAEVMRWLDAGERLECCTEACRFWVECPATIEELRKSAGTMIGLGWLFRPKAAKTAGPTCVSVDALVNALKDVVALWAYEDAVQRGERAPTLDMYYVSAIRNRVKEVLSVYK